MNLPWRTTGHGLALPPATGLSMHRPPLSLEAGLVLAALAAWALRLALQAGSGASLHVDEAQYWDWSRALQWGYYSKPPVIAVLIRASTELFGHGETGVRALVMLCHPAAAVVIGLLAYDVVQGTLADAARAARWSAAIYLASPIAALLGMVATTDAPLVLCWAVALSALWHAVVRRRRSAWTVFALACWVGLMSKYTFATLPAGAAIWVAWRGGPRDRLAVAFAIALVTLAALPHLAWNWQHGWPTFRHTAEITVAGDRPDVDVGHALGRILEFVAAQGLIVGPLAVAAGCLWGASRGARVIDRRALEMLLVTSAPLAVAGLVQASRGGAQINWILPIHLGVALWLGCHLAAATARPRRWAAAALGVQLVLCSLVALAPRIANAMERPVPASMDAWARMRGWRDALHALSPRLADHPDALLVFGSRASIAQAAYHLRTLDLPRAAWTESTRPHSHYELTCPWSPSMASEGREVLLVTEGPPTGRPGLVVLAVGRGRVGEKRSVELWVSEWRPGDSVVSTGRITSWCR